MTHKPGRYRYVGRHVDDLADGRPLEPGGYVDLAKDDLDAAHTTRLIADGLLISADQKKKEGDS